MSKLWRFLGSVVLVSVLAWRMDWSRLTSAFAGLDGRFWLAALGLYLMMQVVSAWRWRLFARAVNLGGTWRQYLS
ncbi:MAG: hypothetical protein ACRD36_07705, partial [Candidatus Acidiferrum sp.]